MKISCTTLLALSVYHGVSAFSVMSPSTAQSSTQLYSSIVAGSIKDVPETSTKAIWEAAVPTTVQGGALKTWSFDDSACQRVQVIMKTDGRPLESTVELWEGPDNTPQKMGIYIEEGCSRPFSAVIATPRNGQNTIAVYNTGHLEFPLAACVEAEGFLGALPGELFKNSKAKKVQGGAVNTVPFGPSVDAVQILLMTDGRPLNARIELYQGPNNNKQVVEIYSEDGRERPFFIVIETPGVGNVFRVCNKANVEFPMLCRVEPYEAKTAEVVEDPWDNGEGSSFEGNPPM
eukprot:CAMPEP_0202458610 /NCGR_PEP_ID=MMETSP1360-20130828/26483_1 /ASSEMBLY_ACC=CAM_ASM_000848 /TAXON_ID=515479 /ORGANISM="Licmophora paradoxa, Strain CCMP2313" /LENGTH=288 /DNA_ID=CAMNT_0049079231 /DNA_START=50 /DNA_END=916 /DNA_ORIENTATION=-